MGYETNWTGPGAGCVSVIPGALIWLVLVPDGAGPGGWRGLAGLFGWLAISIAALLLFTALCGRMDRPGRRGWPAACLLAAAIALFTVIPHCLLFAPMWIRAISTTALQVVGLAAVGLLMAGGSYRAWRWRQGR